MTKRVRGWRVGVAGLGAWALLTSAGCDQRSDSAKAVDGSTRDLHALTGASPEPAMSAEKAKTLGKVASDLAPAIANGDAGEKGTASLLVAQTQAGLGEQAMSEAAEAERKASNIITQVNSLLSNWKMRSAAAAGAAAYDPSAQRAEIAKGKQEKDAAIQREQAHKGEVVGQLTDLQGKAKAKMDAAAAKETEYGRLMQEAVKLTATQAAPKVEQANRIKREADALRLDGTKLEAQASAVAPLVTEIDAVISQLTNQKKDLEESDAALSRQAAAANEEASKERAEATKANVEIEKLVESLKQLRAGDVESSYTKAAGLFNKASSAAREAIGVAPGSGKATQGDAQMRLADMHWHKAHGLKAYALMLESLAAAEPALPKRAEFADAAKGAREASKQELEGAATALEAARQSFGSTRASGDAKERLNKLGELLETAVKVSREDTQGVSADLASMTGRAPAPAAATPAGAGDGAPAPAAGASDPAVVAALDAFLAASREGRSSDLLGMMYVPDAAKPGMQAMTEFAAKADKLDKAFRSKFGKGFAEAAAANPMMAGMAGQLNQMGGLTGVAKNKDLKASDFKVTVNGDAATATNDTIADPLTFKKVDGKWLLYDKNLESAGAQMGAMAPMMAPMGKAFDEVAGEVEAGKYADANAAIAALMQKAQAAMMGAGGPPGGPRKGPGGG